FLAMREIGVLLVLVVGAHSDNVAAKSFGALYRFVHPLGIVVGIDQREVLNYRELVTVAGLLDLLGCGDDRGLGAANRISIEAVAIADASGELTAVAQMQRDAVVGHAIYDQHRSFQRAAVDGDPEDVFLIESALRRCLD